MKKYVLILVAIFVISPAMKGDDDPGNDYPDFKNWTEERITRWEDSVKRVLYPTPELRWAEGSPNDSRNNEREEEEPTRGGVVNNTYVPNSVTLDLTKAVGEIPFSTSVAPSGAVIYNVPIEVYPGIHGMQPQLSLVYNSMGGNGILGMGWGIGGLSSINRGNRSMHYDKKTQGIEMTKDDAFYIDGMRLIKLSDSITYAKYESEQGFIKATAYLNGTIVKYFDVFFPNGTKGTYGYTNTTTSRLEYPMSAISDLYGNKVTYTYSFSSVNNHYQIDKITYANASVEFQYKTTPRPDVITAYSGGLKITEDKLLQKIVCKYGTAVLRNYEFDYTFQKEASLLNKIDYSASGGSSFNPLRFYYGTNNTATVYDKDVTQLYGYYYDTSKKLRVYNGKFDPGLNMENDGLITLPENNSYWQFYRNPFLGKIENRFDNLYTGTEIINLYTGLKFGGSNITPLMTTEAGFINIFCASIDGKQSEKVIKVNNIVSGSNDQVIFKVYSNSGTVLDATRTFPFPTVLTDAAGNKSVHPKFYFPGDFNGDGKTEILAVSCHEPFGWTTYPTKCYVFDLEAGVIRYDAVPLFTYNIAFAGTQQTDSTIIAHNTDKLFVLDYDGDGKSDICLINTTGTHIYTFDGTSYTMRHVASYTGLKRADLNWKLLMIGEFNGDGKHDFLISPLTLGTEWFICYSKGNGQFERLPATITTRFNTDKFLIQDVNSDGLSDVIQYNTHGFYTYLAKPEGFTSSEDYTAFTYTFPQVITAGLNSRNNFNQLLALQNNTVTLFSHKRNDTKEKLLTGAVTSLGVVGKNYYRMLTQPSGFYTQGFGATFPYENFKGPLFVTECREQYFNNTKNENISYTYENAVIHKQGLGFRGFEKITTLDEVRGRTGYQKFDPLRLGLLIEDDSPVAKNTYTYTVTTATNKTVKTQLTQLKTQDKLKETEVTATYSAFDATSNKPKTETINYGGGITETIANVYYNNTDENGYLLGFNTSRTATVNRNGATWKRQNLIQSHSNGQPEVVIRYENGNQVSHETFWYDAKGNDTTRVLKLYASTNTLKTSYTYDSYGRLKTQTDPLGLTVTSFYNTSNGQLDSIRNHKKQTTKFSYDPFGRISRTDYINGGIETSSYFWTTSEKGTNTVYCNYRHYHGKPWTKTFYDALGRETASNALILGGAETGPCKQYDSYGRLWKVSLPSTGLPSLWNVYQYDSYDRPTMLTEASGRITSYAYSKDTIKTIVDSIPSTRIFDTQGNLIQVIDPGGTITYDLRPDGQPASIVAPGNVTTSFTYDKYGRQLTITDPSAGLLTYTYDTEGNLATVKDANNKTVSYAYDLYNRMIKKTAPEFIVHYRYNADGLLVADSISANRFTAYTYDAFGRLLTEKETVDANRWLQKYYGSYGGGRIDWITYYLPDGFVTTETYSVANSNEGLAEITVDGTVIFKRNTVNVFGQTTNVTTGSFNRTYSYDKYGLPTGRTAGSLQSITYNLNTTTGNLKFRKDVKKNIQEDFSYDNLNRLTTFAGKTATYYPNGNINTLSDVGSYQYNLAGKPYTLSGITPVAGAPPPYNQTVTYTSFKRPATISEGDYTAAFTYNGNGERTKMELKKNGVKELDRYYISDCYEIDDQAVGGIKEKLYLGGDFYTAPAVYVKEGSGSWQLYYICRDMLGSITHVTKSNGTLQQEMGYDAWGRLRNPTTQAVYAPGSEPALFLGRGYTGHEHLTQLGLINMNARLYDPWVGRFLSPDPFVQAPGVSQSYNRYSYCLNNPFKYTDPSGELLWTILGAVRDFITNTFVKSWTQGINAWSKGDNWHITKMGWEIDKGMFRTDDKKNFGGRAWELISRHSWQGPQTLIGNIGAGVQNLFGGVRSVTNYGGATVVECYGTGWGAVSFGTYIQGQRGIQADPKNILFQHEYGHYLQSQTSGLFYFSKYGLPSVFSKGNNEKHGYHPAEVDANVRALTYFMEKEPGFTLANWELDRKIGGHPIPGLLSTYRYKSSGYLDAMKKGRTRLEWFDYLLGPNIILSGLINALVLNSRY